MDEGIRISDRAILTRCLALVLRDRAAAMRDQTILAARDNAALWRRLRERAVAVAANSKPPPRVPRALLDEEISRRTKARSTR